MIAAAAVTIGTGTESVSWMRHSPRSLCVCGLVNPAYIMGTQSWQYLKSLSLWGCFLVPMRKTVFSTKWCFWKCKNTESFLWFYSVCTV